MASLTHEKHGHAAEERERLLQDEERQGPPEQSLFLENVEQAWGTPLLVLTDPMQSKAVVFLS